MAGTDPSSGALFISHNAVDRPFAMALETAIRELVGSETRIDVRYSTSDEAGPQGGDRWREWIYRQVVEARTALVVVTPHAIGKPWLLWEAGACWGAALAQARSSMSAPGADPGAERGADRGSALGARLIVSIAYGLTENECPDPLRGDQIVGGLNEGRMRLLLQQVLEAHELPSKVLLKAGERMQGVLDRYIAAAQTAMLQAPSPVNEANVQDWLSRLDALVQADRLSELQGFHRWMTLAFGRDAEGSAVPIDVRLHRRLGELYLGQKQFALAVEQFTLARRAAPRDIYVLRPLVEAAMKLLLAARDAGDAAMRERIEQWLAAIRDLDDRAFVAAPDAAALYGNYLRRVVEQPEAALRVYHDALQANPDSYYLADLQAQTELALGRVEAARDTYRQALAILERLREQNVWSLATAATACVALGDTGGAGEHVAAIAALRPAPSEANLDAVARGLRDVATRTGFAPDAVEALVDLLRQAR